MFQRLDPFAKNDVVVKLIFDHVKNSSVAFGLMAAAVWLQSHSRPGWAGLWDVLSGAVLAFAGFGLVWINVSHMYFKLDKVPWGIRLRIAFVLFYTAAGVAFYRYLVR